MVPESDRPQDRELTLAVMANSRKENEHRLPLDPRHLSRIPPELRPRVFLETGYGASQGFTDAELAEFVSAADIYVTPYLKPEQITSGTLAYALGSGKAVISTPYWYAEELLANGRGLLVPWRDSAAIAKEAIELLANDADRHAMQRRALAYTSEMAWPCVAGKYVQTYERAVRRHKALRGASHEKTTTNRPAELLALRTRQSTYDGE